MLPQNQNNTDGHCICICAAFRLLNRDFSDLVRRLFQGVEQFGECIVRLAILELCRVHEVLDDVGQRQTLPRCQDSCRLIGFIQPEHWGRKELCNAALLC